MSMSIEAMVGMRLEVLKVLNAKSVLTGDVT